MKSTDEWWWGGFLSDTNCSDSDPSYHGLCGYTADSNPDGYLNYEWRGVMRAVDNGAGIDIMEKREIFYNLQDAWTGIIPENITVTSPDGGENWATGSLNTISWRFTGNPGPYVKIELYKGGMLSRMICYALTGSGGNAS
jgi:hypothetical protein